MVEVAGVETELVFLFKLLIISVYCYLLRVCVDVWGYCVSCNLYRISKISSYFGDVLAMI
jgi:hypothetical protein